MNNIKEGREQLKTHTKLDKIKQVAMRTGGSFLLFTTLLGPAAAVSGCGKSNSENEDVTKQQPTQRVEIDLRTGGNVTRALTPDDVKAIAAKEFARLKEEEAAKKAAETKTTVPATTTTTQTPEARNFRTGIPVPEGTELQIGKSAIVREIDWNTNEVWIWWSQKLDHSVKIGKGVIHDDGNQLQVRDAWTTEGQGQWTSIAQEALNEARNIQGGSLGRTGMTIHFMQTAGGFGNVPDNVNR